MAKDEAERDGPSLELPSLGFGRKRRRQGPETAAGPEPTTEDGTAAPAPGEAAPDEPTDVLPAAAPPAPVAPAPEPVTAPPLYVDEVEPRPAPDDLSGEAPTPPAPRDRPRRELPAVGAMVASAITGLLVGVITVGLTWGSLRLCEVVRGTSSCGTPGFLLLIAIMIATVLLGSLLLRSWGVPDPGSTSFLAVGLLAVLALLFLVDVLFSWSMILVIPAFAMATFALAHWVTTAFIEPADH
jgi:hypothetical protein